MAKQVWHNWPYSSTAPEETVFMLSRVSISLYTALAFCNINNGKGDFCLAWGSCFSHSSSEGKLLCLHLTLNLAHWGADKRPSISRRHLQSHFESTLLNLDSYLMEGKTICKIAICNSLLWQPSSMTSNQFSLLRMQQLFDGNAYIWTLLIEADNPDTFRVLIFISISKTNCTIQVKSNTLKIFNCLYTWQWHMLMTLHQQNNIAWLS